MIVERVLDTDPTKYTTNLIEVERTHVYELEHKIGYGHVKKYVKLVGEYRVDYSSKVKHINLAHLPRFAMSWSIVL